MRLLREVGIHLVEQRSRLPTNRAQQNDTGNGNNRPDDGVLGDGGCRATTCAPELVFKFGQYHSFFSATSMPWCGAARL